VEFKNWKTWKLGFVSQDLDLLFVKEFRAPDDYAAFALARSIAHDFYLEVEKKAEAGFSSVTIPGARPHDQLILMDSEKITYELHDYEWIPILEGDTE
jgi:hypothetical protein